MSEQLTQLADLACGEGGWSYSPGQLPHMEPTCLALLALGHRPEYAAVVAKAQEWLKQCASGDGTYRLARGRHEAAWATALVLTTRSVLGTPTGELEGTARGLLALRGKQTEMSKEDNINDIDGALLGWPWAEGTFSWVEPTSWACLGLRRIGQGEHPRVAEGQKLLLDRVLATGGLNYGNRRIFGITLEAIPTPTSLALLALQGMNDERISKTVAYLRERASSETDVEHLGWAILTLHAYDQPRELVTALVQRLREAYQTRLATPYVQPAPLLLALMCLAEDIDSRNPFRLPATESRPALTPAKLLSPRKGIGDRVKSFFQGIAVNAVGQLKPLEPPAPVHIAPCSDYNADIQDVLSRQYEGFRDKVPLKGKRVVLKPNLVEYHRDKVINTHPNVVAGVIELCQREGASEVIVAEGPGHWRNVEYLVAASGLGDVLRHYKVPFIDLNHDEPVKTINLGRLTKLEHLYLSRTIASADVVISLPKLKTHHWAVATLSLKNLFGTMPGICYGWPKNELHWRGIHNSIVDIAMTRTPDLAIVDGIVGMEGDGPLNGSPKPTGVLIMGADLVAVDATCCRLMKLDPEKVAYLLLAARKKLGLLASSAIEQRGETIEQREQAFATVDLHKALWMGRGA